MPRGSGGSGMGGLGIDLYQTAAILAPHRSGRRGGGQGWG